MSDDKAHEYVPVEWRDWPGDRRERAERAEAERTQALAALAEMTREVNARLVQVTKERNAARRWAKAWKAKAKSVREELRGMTAAYDKAVWGAKARIAQLEHELKLYAPYHVMREQRDAALARAEKCEHERALSQHLREDDHR